jgi:hypothetical protein
MEPVLAVSVFAANPWLAVVGGALSVLAFAATVLVLGATAAERDGGPVASGRALCVPVERGLRRHASTPQREQHPLCRAVTRPLLRCADGEVERVERPSADVTDGGWL